MKNNIKKYYAPSILIIVIVIIFSTYHFHNQNNCSIIAIIPITGELVSSPRYNADGSLDKTTTDALGVVAKIRKAEKNNEVKAIVFMIDSSGGDGRSAEEIATAIKEINKPTVSLIRSSGISAAYWIASATGHIFALPLSDVGDIGVTMSYIDNVTQDETNGLTFHQLTYGKYKDTMNPDKPLTADEQKLIMGQVTESANMFIQAVAENRHLPIEKVRALADGSVILAQDAIKDGLIDQIGSFADVDIYLSKTLNRNVAMCILGDGVEK